MRRPPTLDRPRPDRWLVSYADFVTLLLACFATAFAAASESSPALPAPPVQAQLAPVAAVQYLVEPSPREVVAPALALAEVPAELIQDARGLVISLPESATFPSGSADLTIEARSFLARLAEQLRRTRLDLRVEGHTDDRPVRGGRYDSNWELSTARASAVVRYLVTDAAFDPARLSAAGYGEFHPRATNDEPDNRARNRRVDVVVIERAASPENSRRP